MLPLFHRAMEVPMGIIVLNPNVNTSIVKDSDGKITHVPIPQNNSPENHVIYVWDRIISRTTAKNILIYAYGTGGSCAKALIQARDKSLLSHLRAVALTQSNHILTNELNFALTEIDSKATRSFLENHTINWMASTVSLGERVFVSILSGIHAGRRRTVGLHVH